MKKYKALNQFLMVLIFVSFLTNLNAQTGLNFQGVARTASNAVIASQDITLKLSILQGSATGLTEYIEVRKVTTNAQGLFTAVIGDSLTISTLGKFSDIDWKLSPKFLKIEIDPAAGNNFITMGTTQFQFVAYAKFANSVLAENISGIVPVARGGTGSNSLTTLKSNLALDKVNNTADSSKPISKSTQLALDQRLNIVDSTKAYVTPTQLASFKFSTTTSTIDTTNLSYRINSKLNTVDTSSLFRKSDTTSLYNRINIKLNSADTSSLLRKSDTTNLYNRINIKLNSADTSSLLRKSDTTNLYNRINLKLNSADTSSLLRKSDTTNLYNRINLKLNSADTSSLLRKSDTTNLYNRINLKLNSADTSSLLRKSDTTNLYNRINLKLNINDTAILLRKSDTATLSNRIDFKLNINDTSSLLKKSDTSTLSNRINLKLNKSDTSTLSNRINLKLNISDTSNLLNKSQLGAINGAASLDAAGKIPSVQIPAISFSSVDVVNSMETMLSFTSSGTNSPTDRLIGSIVVRLDSSKNFVLAQLPASIRSNWVELVTPNAPVQTVNGFTGNVKLLKANIPDLINVDNTSDLTKPLSLAASTAIDLKLNITDTSNLLKKSDTSFLLQKVDTTAILAMYAKKFTKDVKINGTSLGKYANGATIPAKGKTLDEFLEDLVSNSIPPTFSIPSVTIGASPSAGPYEIGYDPGLVTLSSTYNKNDGGNANTTIFYKGGTALGANTNSPGPITTTVTYSVTVNYAAGTATKNDNLGTSFPNTITAASTSKVLSFSSYSKRYWGGASVPFSSTADIRTLTTAPSSDNSGSSQTHTVNLTPTGTQNVFFAYLATSPDLTSILYNGLEQIDSYTKAIVTITNAQGYSQNYKVYTSKETYSSILNGVSFR
jgi:hypothetical protein